MERFFVYLLSCKRKIWTELTQPAERDKLNQTLTESQVQIKPATTGPFFVHWQIIRIDGKMGYNRKDATIIKWKEIISPNWEEVKSIHLT